MKDEIKPEGLKPRTKRYALRIIKMFTALPRTDVAWVAEQSKTGVLPHQFGVFVRSAGQLGRAQAALKESGLPFKILDEHVQFIRGVCVWLGAVRLGKT